MLSYIQNRYGGSVKLRSGVKAFRYRLQNREGMLQLVHDVNGNIRNSKRIVQFYNICSNLNIQVLPTIKLTKYNAWFSGFFDADGTINYYYSKNQRPQLILSVTNKYRVDIEEFQRVLGGTIYFDGYFKWTLQNEKEHLNYSEYNKLYPSRSYKGNRIFLLKEFYKLYNKKAYKKEKGLYETWERFEKKWQRRVRLYEEIVH